MKKQLLLLFLSLLPMLAMADESGSCGDNVTWTYTSATGTLTIQGLGAMKDYYYVSDVPWFSYRSSIKTVVINEGVTSIGSNAFNAYSGLTSVSIPNSVTIIEKNAFYSCFGLASITIPNSVTSIRNYAFSYCSGLTSITFGNNLASIGYYAFSGCSGLTTVTIPNSVTNIGYSAFKDCSALNSITIPNSVTNIANSVFEGCSNLTSIEISNSVTSIGGYAFYGCSGLTSVTIGNSVTSIGEKAFYGCSGLTSITIPNSVTYVGIGAFSGCSGLPSIIFPNSVTSIGEGAFRNCSGLTFVTIGNNVTSIGINTFAGCTGLNTINYFSNTPPTGWIATVNTYVPNIQSYSTPKEYINGASSSSIKQMISFDNNEFTYTGQKPTPKWTNNVEGYNAELSFQSLNINAGNYQDNLPATFTKDNKSFVVNIPYNYSIKQVNLTVKANNVSRQYGEKNPTLPIEYTGFVNSETEDVLTTKPVATTTVTKTSPVGTYPITVSGGEATNYAFTYVQGELTVSKASLTAKVKDVTKVYGEENPSFDIEYAGFVNSENEDVLTTKPVATTTATKTSPVGTYPITVSGGETTNYAFTYEQGELTVNKAGLSAKVKDATKVYGDENPSFDIEYVGLKNGETAPEWTTTPTIQTEATKTSDVGDYAIKANDGVAKNYDLAIADGKLTVTQAPLTITATNASRQYFDDEPAFEYSCTGFRKGDDKQALTKEPAIVTEAEKTSAVGTYKITPGSAEAKNYAISYEQGELTITKRELKATSHSSRQYGEENPTLPIEYTGFVNSETEDVLTTKPVGTTTATKTSPVGTYPITVSGGEATNYSFTYEQGELTVNKAGLSAKVKDATKVYGEENPSFDIEYVGLKNGETVPEWTTAPTIQTTATKTSDVGDYTIKANDAVAKNYDLAIADGKLTITPAPLTIKANDMTRLYYSENPTLDYTCNGFVNGDDKSTLSVKPNLSTLATLTSNVGDYDIEASGAVNPNYSISYEKGKLSITPRILTASVGNYERVYNEENPAFEVTYAGFVGNEDESIITTKAVATTTATKTSDAGTYPIEVSGGGATNYVFSYNSGTLTINKAEQTISWEQDLTGLKVGEQVELKAESTSGLPVTYQMESNNVAEVYAAGTKWYLDCKADGEVQIVAMQEGNQNYYSSTRIRKIVAVGVITGIRAAKSDQNDNLPTYDTMGRKVQELKKGQLYIRQGKKFVVK